MPDEVLEEFVGVLLLDNQTGCLDDVTRVGDELLTVRGELVDVDWGVRADVLEGLVDLGVVRELAVSESLDDAVEAHLAVDIGGLGLLVCGDRHLRMASVAPRWRGRMMTHGVLTRVFFDFRGSVAERHYDFVVMGFVTIKSEEL